MIEMGKFQVKILETEAEFKAAFSLRYRCFQIEMAKALADTAQADHDQFDDQASHLGIIDQSTQQVIATCRLLNSVDAQNFYSEQEFNCTEILSRPGIKIEIGRVCVHPDFRRGIVLMLLWRGIAETVLRLKADILFGCASIPTLDPVEAAQIYSYLKTAKKLQTGDLIYPKEKYRCLEFNRALHEVERAPDQTEWHQRAQILLPPLCRTYFDIGCLIAGPPAFDEDFNCIDFLTILEIKNMDLKLKRKVLGGS